MTDIVLIPEQINATMTKLDELIEEYTQVRSSYEEAQTAQWAMPMLETYPPNFGDSNGDIGSGISDTEQGLREVLDNLHQAVEELYDADDNASSALIEAATALNLDPDVLGQYLRDCANNVDATFQTGSHIELPDFPQQEP
ncbi:hypothetical protein [Actinobaculum sp. 313]|uniref:hypothetical protein n=1 Tax=Actinobaculum sp. 313 TaxID=2495645 RepID=UPI000D5288BF|nr:hypothetical protein [Actinobaculum sp. 313]AWE42647.1 hypothetical protein DDD63_07680 [Actinobaculum sp. 313]